LESKVASTTWRNVTYGPVRVVDDLASFVQDLDLELDPLDWIHVVVVHRTHDGQGTLIAALQLPFDPEEPLLGGSLDLRRNRHRRSDQRQPGKARH
jgi:hypothetical protein